MLDPSAQAAPLPPEMDPAMLAQLLGGGAPPGAPMPGMDPGMAPMPGMGGPDPMMGGDPALGMMPAGGNPYPTTDPQFMAQMLGQIVEAQQMDAAQMQSDQQGALTGNPIFQALADGAPMGPGAGQDGAALEMGSELPALPGMS